MTDAKAGPTAICCQLWAECKERCVPRLERALAAATLRADIAALTLKHICDEWNEGCDPECDSYGHTETCKATNIAAAKRVLRERAESAQSRLSALEAALREPTEAMLANVYEMNESRARKGFQRVISDTSTGWAARLIWDAMISALPDAGKKDMS